MAEELKIDDASAGDDFPTSAADEVMEPGCGYPGYLSEAQEQMVQQLAGRLDPAQVASVKFRAESEESFFCRFLRARKFDLEATVSMFNECVALREQSQPLQALADGAEGCVGAPLPEVLQFYGHWYHGFDRMNRPVYFEHTGQIDIEGLLWITDNAKMLRYHQCTVEGELNDLFERAAARGPSNVATCCILDLAGLNRKIVCKAVLNFVKEMAAYDQICCPELLGKMLIINAPGLFASVWRMISKFLDPRTCSKIEILTTRDVWQPRLLHYVAPDQLPEAYGGTCTCAHQEGGCLPNTRPLFKGELGRGSRRIETLHVPAGDVAYVKYAVLSGDLRAGITRTVEGGAEEVIKAPTLHQDCTSWVVDEVAAPADRPAEVVVTLSNPSRMQTKTLYARFEVRTPAGEVIEGHVEGETTDGEEEEAVEPPPAPSS